MKTPINLLLLILFFSFNSCSKQDDCDNPVDCLPPATQTGANTAGCLVNGEVFLPGGKSLGSGSVLKAQYVFHNGSYIFGVSIRNRNGQNRMIQIESRNNKLEEGGKYFLKQNTDTTSSGLYLLGGGLVDAFITTNQISGEFKITHLDETSRIISGTFWFDAVNNEGEIVQVREGRFDVRYY
ncbi:hypothetical protein BH23BAC2_BH23BAC2_26830 [soil metagenome]